MESVLVSHSQLTRRVFMCSMMPRAVLQPVVEFLSCTSALPVCSLITSAWLYRAASFGEMEGREEQDKRKGMMIFVAVVVWECEYKLSYDN